MKWWERNLGNFVHVLFVLIAVLFFAVPTMAQRHDPYVVEKLQQEEGHLDHTDGTVKENHDMAEAIKSRIDRDEGIFLGGWGILGFIGCAWFIKQFNRGKETNA